MIVHKDNKWLVMDSSGKKVLGTHYSKSDAVDQMQAIEISKKRRKEVEESQNLLNNSMSHLTNYYKNLCDELSARRDFLTSQLNEYVDFDKLPKFDPSKFGNNPYTPSKDDKPSQPPPKPRRGVTKSGKIITINDPGFKWTSGKYDGSGMRNEYRDKDGNVHVRYGVHLGEPPEGLTRGGEDYVVAGDDFDEKGNALDYYNKKSKARNERMAEFTNMFKPQKDDRIKTGGIQHPFDFDKLPAYDPNQLKSSYSIKNKSDEELKKLFSNKNSNSLDDSQKLHPMTPEERTRYGEWIKKEYPHGVPNRLDKMRSNEYDYLPKENPNHYDYLPKEDNNLMSGMKKSAQYTIPDNDTNRGFVDKTYSPADEVANPKFSNLFFKRNKQSPLLQAEEKNYKILKDRTLVESTAKKISQESNSIDHSTYDNKTKVQLTENIIFGGFPQIKKA